MRSEKKLDITKIVFLIFTFSFFHFSYSGTYQSQIFNKSKVQLDWDYLFTKDSVREANKNVDEESLNQQSSNNLILPKDIELSIIVDMSCFQSEVSSQWLKDLTSLSKHPGLSLQSFVYKVENSIQVADLKQELDKEKCVVGVSEEGTAEAMAVKDYIDDPLYMDQHHLSDIELEEGLPFMYESSLKISENTKLVVAIVDSGVDYRHNDLTNQMWQDADGTYGYDFVNDDNDPMDDNSHGTHCAGVIAAESSNQTGISGIISFNTEIMGVKVLNASGSGSSTDIANGIRYAAEKGADLINVSLGGRGASAAFRDAIAFAISKGATVFASAGNNNELITNNNFYRPSGYGKDLAGLISVGSHDAITSRRSFFSNYSTEFVEISAPGSATNQGDILSTVLRNGYDGYFGTSMSTPVALGVAAIAVAFLKTHQIDYSPALIEDLLMEGSIINPQLTNAFKDGKQVNIPRLLEVLKQRFFLESDGNF